MFEFDKIKKVEIWFEYVSQTLKLFDFFIINNFELIA